MRSSCFPTRMARSIALLIPLLCSVVQLVYSQQQQFLSGSEDILVEPFGSTVLQCRVNPADLPSGSSDNLPLFSWRFRKTGQTVQDSENVVTSGLEMWFSQRDIMQIIGDQKQGEFNLKIANVTYDSHDGDYYCEVNIPAFGDRDRKSLRSKPFHLYVKYQPQPPQIEFSDAPENLVEDQRLVITCSSRDGNPPPQITWMRNGALVPSTYTAARNRYDISKAELVIDKLTKDHNQAVYTCVVKNDAIAQSYQKVLSPLDVKYKPRISVGGYLTGFGIPAKDSSGVLAVESGNEVILTCAVDANPPVSIPSWRRNNQLFQQSSYNFTFTQGSLTRDSAGVYSCVASNGIGGEQVGEIRLDVYYNPIVAVQPPIIQLREGGSGSLRCLVDSNPKADMVEWYNAAGVRVATTDILSLSDVQRRDAGSYECRAKTHFQPSTGATQVTREGRGSGRMDVLYRPGSAAIDALITNAFVGGPISLRCTASDLGLPEARFRWRKVDRSSISSSGAFFNISDAKLDDIGDYECTPYNEVGDGVPKVFHLEVSERVSWTPDNNFVPDIIRKKSDNPLSLSCSARGRPAPQFKWLKDGVELVKSDRLYRIFTDEPSSIDRYSFITRSELRFEGPSRTELFSANDTLQRTDRGRYTCRAFNDAGQPINHETHVLIQYPPVFRNRYTKVATDISPASSTQIECLVESRPPPQISWTRNGQPILSSIGHLRVDPMQGIDEEGFKSVLTIDSTTGDDLGDYRCSATNLIGDSTLNLSVVRRSVPDEPRNLKQKDLAYNAVTLTWDTGFDGGYPQKYFIVMRKSDGSVQEIHVPDDVSDFRVEGLVPTSNYNFRLYSENRMGKSRDSGENLDVRTPVKPILPEDIPTPSYLKFDVPTGMVSFGSPDIGKKMNLCATISTRRGNDAWNPIARCFPFSSQGIFRVPGPSVADLHVQVQYCLVELQDTCGQAVDDQTILLLHSTAEARLDIILPIVIVLAVVFLFCLAMFCFCRKRIHRAPIKTVKASTSTLATTGSVHTNGGGFYGDGYTNKALQENANLHAMQNGKTAAYLGMESQYGNGSIYAQVDKKLNGDLHDGGMPYKTQLSDPNGNMYSNGNLYVQAYPNYDEGYSHQHSPMDPSFTHLPVEVNGLPDPYEEYEKTPSFGEESVESGYSTSNSRGRRVIREIIV